MVYLEWLNSAYFVHAGGRQNFLFEQGIDSLNHKESLLLKSLFYKPGKARITNLSLVEKKSFKLFRTC